MGTISRLPKMATTVHKLGIRKMFGPLTWCLLHSISAELGIKPELLVTAAVRAMLKTIQTAKNQGLPLNSSITLDQQEADRQQELINILSGLNDA